MEKLLVALRSLPKSAAVKRAKAKLAAALSKGKAVLMSAAFGLSLSVPALASDGSGSGSASDMVALVASTDTITSMVSKVWTIIMSNALLTLYAGTGVLTIGIGVFLYVKKAARR